MAKNEEENGEKGYRGYKMKRAVEIIFFASTKKSVSTPVLLVVTLPDKAGRLATDVRAPAFASVGVRSVGMRIINTFPIN